jgi:hypothetical protein
MNIYEKILFFVFVDVFVPLQDIKSASKKCCGRFWANLIMDDEKDIKNKEESNCF